MEALVLIFAEILIACLAPLFGLIGMAFGVLLELMAALFGGIFSSWLERRKKSEADTKKSPRKPLIPRKVIHWSAGIAGLIGVLGLIASFVLFQPLLRYVMTAAADKANATIAYERAEGVLLTGNVALYGIHMTRENETGLAFDLQVGEARADVDIWSLLSNRPVIELGQVKNVTGHISPPKRDKDKPKKKRRPFKVQVMQAAEIDLEIRPKEGPSYTLVIPHAEVAPFNSSTALFDLLFRSNMQAEIAGQPLQVETRKITELGRETYWRFENIEAEKLKLLVPRAPLTWLNGGTLNVRVDDRWSLSEDWVEMDWNVGLVGVSATPPAQAGTREALLAKGLGRILEAKDGTAEFSYKLSLSQQDIESLRSGNLEQFWDVVLSGFIKPGSLENDKETQKIPDEGESGDTDKPGVLDRLKGLWDKDDSD